MRISDWSSDACSSDLLCLAAQGARRRRRAQSPRPDRRNGAGHQRREPQRRHIVGQEGAAARPAAQHLADHPRIAVAIAVLSRQFRSEEHTSELQSLMRSSYAVFCLKKKTEITTRTNI